MAQRLTELVEIEVGARRFVRAAAKLRTCKQSNKKVFGEQLS